MKEEWRDIKGYKGRYLISSFGRIYSYYKRDYLKPCKDSKGYLILNLCKEGKSKLFKVHRLVAEAFIPNPNNYSQVNHKDENKQNNCVNNLEWCTNLYNVHYGTRTQRVSEKMKGSKNPMYGKTYSKNPRARKVLCITTGKEFDCIKEAAEYYFIDKDCISKFCRGKLKYAGKHPVTGEKLKWKYIDE